MKTRKKCRVRAFFTAAICMLYFCRSTIDVKADYTVDMTMQKDAKDGEYNRFFLKDDIQTISIDIDEENLQYLFDNAMDKPSVKTNSVTIGDSTIGFAGLKTKGSYTLEHAVLDNPDSNRYSLTINFGKYIKKKDYGVTQNFYGARKISLNNFFFDKSMMKEYCALTLLTEMGLPTPQYGLTKLYINGDYYGVYFMVEAMDSSILEQYYGCSSKDISDYLCKPEGTAFQYEELEKDPSPLWEADQDTYEDVKDMIPTVLEWAKKLNQLSAGTDFEGNELDVNSDKYLELLNKVMDVDEALRYFAANSFLVQTDNMFVGLKNFGLYVDKDGRSLLVPWDYDLSFGCYSPGDAESTANYNIDMLYTTWGHSNPTEKAMMKYYRNYPLFYVLFQNDSLREKMHTYMEDCAKIMALGGTTSFGKSYVPGKLHAMIETLQEPLTEAATEKVVAQAQYMNNNPQPSGVKKALPNLSKIIALRSVGVYAQVHGMDTVVSGKGANNETLGNGLQTWRPADSGNITAVDAATGIFVSAEYKGKTPVLHVESLSAESSDYTSLLSETGIKEGQIKGIYAFSKVTKAEGSYTVTIPTDPATADDKVKMYGFSNGKLTRLETTRTDNLYSAETESLEYILLVSGNQRVVWLPVVAAIVTGIILAAVVILVLRRRKAMRNN